jgi:hypothetical protein
MAGCKQRLRPSKAVWRHRRSPEADTLLASLPAALSGRLVVIAPTSGFERHGVNRREPIKRLAEGQHLHATLLEADQCSDEVVEIAPQPRQVTKKWDLKCSPRIGQQPISSRQATPLGTRGQAPLSVDRRDLVGAAGDPAPRHFLLRLFSRHRIAERGPKVKCTSHHPQKDAVRQMGVHRIF